MKAFRLIILQLTIIFLVFFYSYCQPSPLYDTIKNDIKIHLKSTIYDLKQTIISPVKWDKREWLITGTTLGATGLLMLYDKNINTFIHYGQNRALDLSTKYFFKPLGATYPIAGSGILYAYGLFSKNSKLRNLGINCGKAITLSFIIVRLPKYIAGRHRPYDDDVPDPFVFESFYGFPRYTSFVSGHTAIAFSFATIISSEYKTNSFITIISYSLATIVALSRVYDNEHWISDVLPAAVIGYGIGKLVYNNSKLNINPYISKNFRGIDLRLNIE